MRLPLCCLMPILCALVSGQDLTLEQVAHPVHRLRPRPEESLKAVWLADGSLLETRQDKGVSLQTRSLPPDFRPVPWDASAQEKAKEPWIKLLEGAGLESARAREALKHFNPEATPEPTLLHSGNRLVFLDPKTRRAKLLGETPSFDQALLSPDGTRLAFLKGNDLHAMDLATGVVRALTTGGSATCLNGRLDWVMQEEVYGRGTWRAFWWAPDSSRLAFLSLNTSGTPQFRITNDRFQPQRPQDLAYPKAGEPNPKIRLGVVDLKGAVTWLPTPPPEQEPLAVQVGFDPQGRVLVWWQNRIQTWAELHRHEAQGPTVLVREENAHGWVERPPLPQFLPDGSFVLSSSRSGYEHLYLHAPDGKLLRPLTTGAWQVKRVLAVDKKHGRLFFEANKDNAIGADAYVTDLTGTTPPRRLTQGGGTHRVELDPSKRWLLDRWSSLEQAGRTELVDLEGKGVRVLEDRNALPSPFRRGTLRRVQVPTRDGYLMDGQLLLPPNFDPAKKYPVFQTGYAGPATPTVHDAWNGSAWEHFLAQKGYVVWKCDPRSASDKGMVYTQTCYRQLGVQELKDYEDGLAWLATQGWADLKRVAIDGWSYGGFMAAYCATASDKWKVAIVGAPVTDFRLYDSIYTERYMGLPKDNPTGYDNTSVVRKAAHTHSSVLLLHGLVDENVHLQQSVMFIQALMEADKDFQVVVFPGAGHSPREEWQVWHRFRTLWDFLQRKL